MNHPRAIKTIAGVGMLLALFAASGLRSQVPAAAAPDFRQALGHFQQGRYEPALRILDSLEQRFPRSADIHHLKAIVLDLLHRSEQANRHFKEAVQLNPASPDMRSNYGTSLMRLGRMEEAVAQFQKALERSPENPTAHFNLGTILLGQERFAEARPHLEKAFSNQPEVYANGYQLALCQFLLQDYAAADRVLAKLSPAPGERLEFDLLQALNDRALGRKRQAADRLSALLPRLNRDSAARRQAAMLLLSQDLYTEALPLLEQAAQEASASSADWMRLAQTRRATGDSAGAAKAALRANQLEESGTVHVFLGELLEEQGKPVEAVAHFQRAVELDPSEDHFFALGYEFLSHWNWETAQQVLEAGLGRHPDSWRLWLALGSAFLGQNQIESAADALLKTIRRSPHPMALSLLALCYEQAGSRQAEVRREFERFYKENPQDPRAIYYWAFANFRDLAGRGDPPETLSPVRQALSRAIQTDPDDFDAHFLMGEIDAYRQDWNAAVAALGQAVALRPQHVEARYKLGLALQRAGRSEDARRELAEYQRLKQRQDQDVSERMSQTRRFIVELKQP